jgi:hypothetical protein
MPRAFDREALLEDAGPRFPFTVALLKALLNHASLLVEQEGAGIWNTPVPVLLGDPIGSVMLVDVLV